MTNSSDNEMIRARESFINEKKIYKNKIRPEILESWLRSNNCRVNPRAAVLPAFISKQEAANLRNDRFFRGELVKEFSKKMYKLLEDTRSVIFYTDENLTIIIQKGNQLLLNELNEFNLGIGTNLKESVVGTNAAALACINNSECSVVGAEHYIDALQNYACAAVQMVDPDDNSIYGYAMFITDKSNYCRYQLSTLEYFIILTRFYLNIQLQDSELTLYNKLLSQSIEQQDRGVIFVDKNGFILKVNAWVRSNLSRGNRGEKFLSSFPELSKAAECLQTGKPLLLQEVYLNNSPLKNKVFFMECQPLKKDKDINGMIISLFDKRTLNKKISQVCNFSAHFVFDDLIGSNVNFQNAKRLALNAADSPSNILITGESGTGKELFAQAIHNASTRRSGPFISINCAAIPRELIGSELFGYVEGAFTGARRGGAQGKFELADKGTIFLDEIGEMPLDMQAVLLRVLEDKRITRLGGCYPVPVDVRVISATNKNLWESVASNQFRLDLYYRLNVVNIDIPPLRNRKEDISLLIDYYIGHFNQVLNKNISGLAPEALELLKNYHFPGNVRELRNIIERGINQCSSNYISLQNLPREIVSTQIPAQPNYYPQNNNLTGRNIEEKISKLINEKETILQLMSKYNGNKTRVAQELGISRVTLYKKLK